MVFPLKLERKVMTFTIKKKTIWNCVTTLGGDIKIGWEGINNCCLFLKRTIYSCYLTQCCTVSIIIIGLHPIDFRTGLLHQKEKVKKKSVGVSGRVLFSCSAFWKEYTTPALRVRKTLFVPPWRSHFQNNNKHTRTQESKERKRERVFLFIIHSKNEKKTNLLPITSSALSRNNNPSSLFSECH